MRIDRLRKNYEIETRWIAFPLHPEIPEEGFTLEQLLPGRSAADMEKTRLRLKQVAHELGLPLGERRRSYNSRLAQELAKWAESQGKGDSFHEAVFRAYFVEVKNIGRVEELVSIARSVDLPEKEARSILESRRYQEAVDADWSRSYQLGITGVPTFVIGHRSAVGFQPYEALEQLLKSCGVRSRD